MILSESEWLDACIRKRGHLNILPLTKILKFSHHVRNGCPNIYTQNIGRARIADKLEGMSKHPRGTA